MQPHMTAAEIELLSELMRAARHVTEFGCGGSTVLAAKLGVPRLTSIDSSREWIEKVSAVPAVAERIAAGDYALQWIDIGPLENWGYPLDRKAIDRWPDYSVGIWGGPSQPEHADLVLVDGRFRVSCVLRALVHCQPATLIAVHDFERPQYQAVLRHTEIVRRADNLVVLRRKETIQPRALAADCATYLLELD